MITIETGFKLNQKGELIYLTIPSFEETELVRHGFTTRKGGVSTGVYSSLNTSPSKTDSTDNVKENLSIVCSAIDIDYKRLVLSDQVHDDKILVVDEKDIGKGLTRSSDIKCIDALITNVPGVPLMTFYADCVPIFILDKAKSVIALVHAGWKGTVLKIAAKTISKMEESFGTSPEDCLVGIGPSIEKECFEVGQEVYESFKNSYYKYNEFTSAKPNGKYHIDLWHANFQSLLEQGVPESNITICGMCTKCNEDLFFSHRRQGESRGSLSAIIELKP